MKFIKLITLFLLTFFSDKLFAQAECGSDVILTQVQQYDNSRYQRIMSLEQHTANYINSVNAGTNNARLTTPNSTIIIPVVVHILHYGEAIGTGRNISDAQIMSQIDVLNEDFRKLNADRVFVPAVFQPYAADVNVEFRLACTDPNGNPTSGITRTLAGQAQFTPASYVNPDFSLNETSIKIKYSALGGKDAWATDRYLNIWVCDMSVYDGYSQFPSDYAVKPNTDGVVVKYNTFGRVGNVTISREKGRTCTHEIGHWLNLFHIWGDQGACAVDDLVGDTPLQSGANITCPTFPHVSCSASMATGDMFMNYMDYSYDNCRNLFSLGQGLRMRAVFAAGGPRAAFINNYFNVIQPTTAFCTTGTVTANNPGCLPITWTIVSGPATIVSGQGTNTLTIQKTGDGVGVIQASTGNYVDEKTVALGTPTPAGITSPGYDLCIESRTEGIGVYNVINPIPNMIYNWQINGVSNGNGISTTLDAAWLGVGTHQLRVRSSSACGYSAWKTRSVRVIHCRNNKLAISPNPANDFINVTLSAPDNVVKNEIGFIREIQLVDKMGAVVYTQKSNKANKSVKVNLTRFKNDVYTLRVYDGNIWVAEKIIIRH